MVHFNKVIIIGTGLIGGSVGLNLHKKGIAREVWGVGRTSENLKVAKERGAVTHVKRVSAPGGIRGSFLNDADLIILATPTSHFNDYISVIAEEYYKDQSSRRDVIVTDVGSTKTDIVDFAEKVLPRWIHFVGAHPIAGSEKGGAQAAALDIFRGRECVITPTRRTNMESLSKVEGMWEVMGARVIRMSAGDHDRVLASVSHLPHLVAYSLLRAVTDGTSPSAIKRVKTDSLHEMTRLAASSPEMWAAICLDNRKHILGALDAFQRKIGFLKNNIRRRNYRGLVDFFGVARKKRQDI